MKLEVSLYVLVLAVPLGLELVRRVSPLLHTPLMSLTNAISAISVVGAILIAGAGDSPTLSKVLGCIAVTSSTINIVGRIPDHGPHAENVQQKKAREVNGLPGASGRRPTSSPRCPSFSPSNG